MIIQKVTHLDAFRDVDCINEWIVTDIDNALPNHRRNITPTINMIVEDLRRSQIIDVWYCGAEKNDLKFKRRKVIYSYGIPTEIIETVLIKDYYKIKDDTVFEPLERKIRIKIYQKIKKKLKKLLPKVVVGGAIIGIIAGGVSLYTSDARTKGIDGLPSDDIVITSEYLDEAMIDTMNNKVVKPPIDILNNYCTIFGFSDEDITRVYQMNEEYILNSPNKEGAIMKCVYEYYVEYLYKKIPTQYNINTEDEMESFIINYAHVLGIDDKEVLYTMLAVHELETGHGESSLCLERNNLGGNIITDEYTNESEFQWYPNAEVGAMDFVMDFYRIYKNTVPERFQDSTIDWSKVPVTNTIEYYMNPVYCTEKMNPDDPDWYEIVRDVKDGLKKANKLDSIEPIAEEYNKTRLK